MNEPHVEDPQDLVRRLAEVVVQSAFMTGRKDALEILRDLDPALVPLGHQAAAGKDGVGSAPLDGSMARFVAPKVQDGERPPGAHSLLSIRIPPKSEKD
jgi:hypothetical protein